MADSILQVTGLREFRRDLKSLGSAYAKGLTKSLKAEAQPIVQDARQRYRKLHPRRKGGKGSQRAIVSAVRATSVAVRMNLARYPYLAGQEFGTNGRWPQFPTPWTKKGRFWWPAIIAGRDVVIKRLARVFRDADKRYFSRR